MASSCLVDVLPCRLTRFRSISTAAAAQAETQGKGKGKGGKGKGKAAPGGPAAKASSDPEVPARSLEVSWSSLSGQVYKWQPWEAEPNAEGAPPLTGGDLSHLPLHSARCPMFATISVCSFVLEPRLTRPSVAESTVEIDPEVEGCNPYEQPPIEIESTYSVSFPQNQSTPPPPPPPPCCKFVW